MRLRNYALFQAILLRIYRYQEHQTQDFFFFRSFIYVAVHLATQNSTVSVRIPLPLPASRVVSHVFFQFSVTLYLNFQVFTKLWEDITKSCTLYNPLMVDIKQFYDGYLHFLRENKKLEANTSSTLAGIVPIKP